MESGDRKLGKAPAKRPEMLHRAEKDSTLTSFMQTTTSNKGLYVEVSKIPDVYKESTSFNFTSKAAQIIDPNTAASDRDEFFGNVKVMEDAMDVVIDSYEGTFQHDLGVYSQVEKRYRNAKATHAKLKEDLETSKELLCRRSRGMKQLWFEGVKYQECVKLLENIEQVYKAPEKFQAYVDGKFCIHAANVLDEALFLLHEPDYLGISALSELRESFLQSKLSFQEIMISDLSSHLYLRKAQCQSFVGSSESFGFEVSVTVDLDRDQFREIRDALCGALDASVSVHEDQQERKLSMAEARRRVSVMDGDIFWSRGVQRGQVMEVDDQVVEDLERDPERDCFHYMRCITESLHIVGALRPAIRLVRSKVRDDIRELFRSSLTFLNEKYSKNRDEESFLHFEHDPSKPSSKTKLAPAFVLFEVVFQVAKRVVDNHRFFAKTLTSGRRIKEPVCRQNAVTRALSQDDDDDPIMIDARLRSTSTAGRGSIWHAAGEKVEYPLNQIWDAIELEVGVLLCAVTDADVTTLSVLVDGSESIDEKQDQSSGELNANTSCVFGFAHSEEGAVTAAAESEARQSVYSKAIDFITPSPFHVEHIYQPAVTFASEMHLNLEIERPNRLKTLLDNILSGTFLPNLQTKTRSKIQRIFKDPEAFKPRGRRLQAYSNDTERRPLLTSVMRVYDLIDRLWKDVIALPSHAVPLIDLIETILNSCAREFKAHYDQTVGNSLSGRNLRDPSLGDMMFTDPAWSEMKMQFAQSYQFLSNQRTSKLFESNHPVFSTEEAAHIFEKAERAFEAELYVSELSDQNLIWNPNTHRGIARTVLLANINDSLEWLISKVQQLASRAASGWRNYCVERFHRVGKKLESQADRSLLNLRLEFRYHCFYYLQALGNTSYQLSVETSEPDKFVQGLNRDLGVGRDYLESYLPLPKIKYVFNGIDRLLGNLLTEGLEQIDGINSNGVELLCLDVLSLQQNLCTLTRSHQTHLDETLEFFRALLPQPSNDEAAGVLNWGEKFDQGLEGWELGSDSEGEESTLYDGPLRKPSVPRWSAANPPERKRSAVPSKALPSLPPTGLQQREDSQPTPAVKPFARAESSQHLRNSSGKRRQTRRVSVMDRVKQQVMRQASVAQFSPTPVLEEAEEAEEDGESPQVGAKEEVTPRVNEVFPARGVETESQDSLAVKTVVQAPSPPTPTNDQSHKPAHSLSPSSLREGAQQPKTRTEAISLSALLGGSPRKKLTSPTSTSYEMSEVDMESGISPAAMKSGRTPPPFLSGGAAPAGWGNMAKLAAAQSAEKTDK